MLTLGLRHAALNLHDPQTAKEFFIRVLKMQLEWEPDAENIYLTSGGQDNLALHRFPDETTPEMTRKTGQSLDHIGFIMPTPEDVTEWHAWVASQGVFIERPVKDHRDGARSFYFRGPEGLLIQMIYHPPVAARAKRV